MKALTPTQTWLLVKPMLVEERNLAPTLLLRVTKRWLVIRKIRRPEARLLPNALSPPRKRSEKNLLAVVKEPYPHAYLTS